MTSSGLFPIASDVFPTSKPFLEIDDDFSRAVVDVAREMDARRTWRERIRDAVRIVRLLLALLWHQRWGGSRG